MRGEPKIQFNIRFPEELYKELRRIAFQRETTMTEIIIKAIRRELEEIRKEGSEENR